MNEETKRGPGRPRKYTGRQRTSIELSSSILKYIDSSRGTDSRSEYVESVLREHFEKLMAKGWESIVREAGL